MNASTRIALSYLVIAVAWIRGSDAVLSTFFGAMFTQASYYKGPLFAVASAAVLYVLLRRDERVRDSIERSLIAANGELERSQADLTAIIDNLPDAFYRTDNDGRIVTMTKFGAVMLGYPLDEVIGLRMADLHATPDGRRAFVDALVAGGGRVRDYALMMRRKDGSLVCAEVNAQFRTAADGTTIGIDGIARDVTERKSLEQKLQHMATHDPLTGLLNRAAFNDRLEHAIAIARRTGEAVVLLFLDLDGFKAVNDTLGHRAGDALLVAVAQRLLGAVRGSDSVGRFGGDEFIVMLEGMTPQRAATTRAQLADAIAVPVDTPAGRAAVTASIGLASFPEHGADAEALLHHADAAMYTAKAAAHASASALSSAL